VKRLALIVLILASVAAISLDASRFAGAFRYQLPTWQNYKAYSPFPIDYTSRLRMLAGWNTEVGDGLNCSGFLSNAHGERFRSSQDFFANRFNDLDLLNETTLRSIDESRLQPGDVAAFEGAKSGSHVAAYLGRGVWIDADSRRGDVSTWQLSAKSASDAFFSGRVRLYRWKHSTSFSPLAILSTLGRDNVR
jgi:hypothetical protein